MVFNFETKVRNVKTCENLNLKRVMRLFILIITLIIISYFCYGMEALLTSRFKRIKCVSLNDSIIFHNCFIRPYSRNYSTVNFAFTHKLPIEAPLNVSAGDIKPHRELIKFLSTVRHNDQIPLRDNFPTSFPRRD